MENDIEIRNERLQHIVGKMPSHLIRYGLYVIIVILLTLFSIVYFFKFPQTIEVTGKIMNDRSINIFFTDKKNVSNIEIGNVIKVIHKKNSIYQTYIAEIDTNIQIKDQQYTLNIKTSQLPDTIINNKRLYLYEINSSINLKIESKSKSVFQHMLQDKY